MVLEIYFHNFFYNNKMKINYKKIGMVFGGFVILVIIIIAIIYSNQPTSNQSTSNQLTSPTFMDLSQKKTILDAIQTSLKLKNDGNGKNYTLNGVYDGIDVTLTDNNHINDYLLDKCVFFHTKNLDEVYSDTHGSNSILFISLYFNWIDRFEYGRDWK